ncbi:MAG: peptidoglycan editing factor PgeF [Burkholderiales bacterium]|nr:peptidoglycan editing factor PgeF [Bacteroidia bacterium]
MYWINSPNINTIHGFSTRHGGVSPEPFMSLNLGGTEDLPENIEENRRRALDHLGIEMQQVSYLNQVHSNSVCRAFPGKQTGDALVTNQLNLAIAVGAADCYPILFYDDKNKVIGAAHCGWKGTLGRIVKNTIEEMVKIGAEKKFIKVAIGQGICAENYEVSEEVIQQFRDHHFPEICWNNRQLDLLKANQFVAEENGILKQHIWSMNRCTTEPDFFSYRRDHGKTGRMWAVIMLK